MWPFTRRPAQPTSPATPATPAKPVMAQEACPTTPCTTCGNPMPVVAFIQACPRCRTTLPPASSCPGGCGSCEMGTKNK